MEEARLQPTFGNVNEAVSLLPRSQPPPAAFPPETGPVAHAQPQQQAAAAGAECTPSFGEPESERHRIVVLCLVALFSFMAGYAFGVYNTSVPGQMRPTAFVPSSDG